MVVFSISITLQLGGNSWYLSWTSLQYQVGETMRRELPGIQLEAESLSDGIN